jgi:phosphate acyltransferase
MMGGDRGIDVTLPAALKSLGKHPNLKLYLVGNKEMIAEKIKKSGKTVSDEKERVVIVETTQVVDMSESPSQALRTKKDSSMRVSINLVKEGRAHACVSAGNTGALMATARFVLKTLPGIDRPAIVASFPTKDKNKEVRILDLGANVDSCADHLYQFAVMGAALVSATDGVEQPKIGLLNIGEEEIKGNDQVKRTAQLLSEKNNNLNYAGYVEGDAIFSGIVDVIVCDGFVGNVALKTMEGASKIISYFAKKEFTRSFLTRLVALVALPILKKIEKAIDPGRRNGASLLGLNGVVIKSHGGADVAAYIHAIDEAILQAKANIPKKIQEEIGSILEEEGLAE